MTTFLELVKNDLHFSFRERMVAALREEAAKINIIKKKYAFVEDNTDAYLERFVNGCTCRLHCEGAKIPLKNHNTFMGTYYEIEINGDIVLSGVEGMVEADRQLEMIASWYLE